MSNAVISLVQAAAALAWPIVVLILGLVFRQDIHSLTTRLLRGKVLGQEFELESISKRISEVAQELPTPTLAANHLSSEASFRLPTNADLTNASQSPAGDSASSSMAQHAGAESEEPQHPPIDEVIDEIVGLMSDSPARAIIQLDLALNRATGRLVHAAAGSEYDGVISFGVLIKRLNRLDAFYTRYYEVFPEQDTPPANPKLGEAFAATLTRYHNLSRELLSQELDSARGKTTAAQYVSTGVELLRALTDIEQDVREKRQTLENESTKEAPVKKSASSN